MRVALLRLGQIRALGATVCGLANDGARLRLLAAAAQLRTRRPGRPFTHGAVHCNTKNPKRYEVTRETRAHHEWEKASAMRINSMPGIPRVVVPGQ